MTGQFHDHAQNARTCTEASKGQLCPRATVFWKHDGLYSNVQFESGLKRAAGGVNIVICRLFEFNRHSNEIEAVSIKNSPWFGPALSTFITGTSVPLSISPELNT